MHLYFDINIISNKILVLKIFLLGKQPIDINKLFSNTFLFTFPVMKTFEKIWILEFVLRIKMIPYKIGSKILDKTFHISHHYISH